MSVGPTAKVPDRLSLENRGEWWKQFKREWKFYEIASKISKEEDEERIAALMNVIGREGMDLFDTFQWQANEDEWKFEEVLRKFDENCQPTKTKGNWKKFCVNSMKIVCLEPTRHTRHINFSVGRSMQVRR